MKRRDGLRKGAAIVLTVVLFACHPGPSPRAEAQTADNIERGESTGLPLPRFVSLGANRVNMRTGPGSRYPIDWVYIRRGLPVEITAEFDLWRKVRDIDGDEGWIHMQLLSGKRTARIAVELATLHEEPDAASPVVLRAGKGVQGKLEECEAVFCQVEVDGVEGWIAKSDFWGAYPAEIFR